MQLNANKFKELLIDFKVKKHEIHPLSIGGSSLSVAHEAKIVGLTISCDLSWNAYISAVIKKVNKRL